MNHPDFNYRSYLGIAHTFFLSDPDRGGYWSRPNLTLNYVATNRGKNGVSPILISCAQATFFETNPTIAEAALRAGFGLSHRGEGVNSVYCDGSARWISQKQVSADGWQTGANPNTGYPFIDIRAVWMSNKLGSGTSSSGNFDRWARSKAN